MEILGYFDYVHLLNEIKYQNIFKTEVFKCYVKSKVAYAQYTSEVSIVIV